MHEEQHASIRPSVIPLTACRAALLLVEVEEVVVQVLLLLQAQ